MVKLILDFKRWSVDPAVLDYCFALFAAIAAMCAVFHLEMCIRDSFHGDDHFLLHLAAQLHGDQGLSLIHI